MRNTGINARNLRPDICGYVWKVPAEVKTQTVATSEVEFCLLRQQKGNNG
ncbi:MAG: hypothetical protein IPH78_13260 [Bacteroidetes bacterium]|nr:hypothetical protein [Bacteroidota bacterium]